MITLEVKLTSGVYTVTADNLYLRESVFIRS